MPDLRTFYYVLLVGSLLEAGLSQAVLWQLPIAVAQSLWNEPEHTFSSAVTTGHRYPSKTNTTYPVAAAISIVFNRGIMFNCKV